MPNENKILIVSTSAHGGMLSVIEGYQRDGLYDERCMEFVSSHVAGSPSKRIIEFAQAFLRAFMLAAKGRIALMHCHVSMDLSFWRKSTFAILGRCFDIPVILHLHGSETKRFYRSLPSFAQRIVSRQLNVADAVVVLSESWRLFVLEVAPKAQVVVIPNYVAIPETIVTHEASSTINVLFLGLIGKRKGVYDLLQAFAAAVTNVPQLFLRIGGDGEIEKAEAMMHDLGLQNHVEFLGWVSGDAKDELLYNADIFVLPSYNEGLPISVLEAMAWGIPVITTTVGGIPQLVEDQVNGFLMEPGDIPKLQGLLEKLSHDPALRHLIGLAGRDTIQKKHSKEVILPLLSSLYAKFMGT